MNRYQQAVENLPLPEGLEDRLREAALTPPPDGKQRRVYKPRQTLRRGLIAAAAAAALTVSAGAVVGWDTIFINLFGPQAAVSLMGQRAFQDVGVVSICDDVTITARQALVDTNSLYLILDYRLPDSVTEEQLRAIADEDDSFFPPPISAFTTGEVTWEDFRAAEEAHWAEMDWTDVGQRDYYGMGFDTILEDYRVSNYSSHMESPAFSPERRTLTYLYSLVSRDAGLDLTAQPLTLLLTPPVLDEDGSPTALGNHPAILTFQPEAVDQSVSGKANENGVTVTATVSPMSVVMEVSGRGLPYGDDHVRLIRDCALVYDDGSTVPLVSLVKGYGGGGSQSADGFISLDFSTPTRELLDTSHLTALTVGDVTVPLK